MANPANKELLETLLDLHELAIHSGEMDIIQNALERCVSLTKSRIGYLHFVNDDQETIELVTWSYNTLRYCEAVFERHYPISQAGIWADCAREKKPFIHNDYQNIPDKAGYPEGHAHLVRHLGVPVMDKDMVRILLGVGNKDKDYDEFDVQVLLEIGQKLWELIRYRREVDSLQLDQKRLHEVQKIALIAGWTYNPDNKMIEFDELFQVIFPQISTTNTLHLDVFLELVVEKDRNKIERLFENPSPRAHFIVNFQAGKDETRLLALKGSPKPRDRGPGILLHGILQDLSERMEQEEIRKKAFYDQLTGLGNRNRLFEFVKEANARVRRAYEDSYALQFIDLDRFKPVNDSYGHLVGDKVLQIIAARIQETIRSNDIAVRIGGDEFIVIQNGVKTANDAASLAKKLIKALSEPLDEFEKTIQVGVSIGIVFGPNGNLDTLINRADKALYESKSAGGGIFTFYDDIKS